MVKHADVEQVLLIEHGREWAFRLGYVTDERLKEAAQEYRKEAAQVRTVVSRFALEALASLCEEELQRRLDEDRAQAREGWDE